MFADSVRFTDVFVFHAVDRILQRQKAQRQAAEDAARERAQQTALVQPEDTPAPPFPVPELPSDEKAPSIASDDTLVTHTPPQDNSRSNFRNSVINWKQKLTGKPPGPTPSMPGPRSSLSGPPSMPGDFSAEGHPPPHTADCRADSRARSARWTGRIAWWCRERALPTATAVVVASSDPELRCHADAEHR